MFHATRLRLYMLASEFQLRGCGQSCMDLLGHSMLPAGLAAFMLILSREKHVGQRHNQR